MSERKFKHIPVAKYIPVDVLLNELVCCEFAIQCDMGGSYDYERIRAIKNILAWIDSPSFYQRLASCGFAVYDDCCFNNLDVDDLFY